MTLEPESAVPAVEPGEARERLGAFGAAAVSAGISDFKQFLNDTGLFKGPLPKFHLCAPPAFKAVGIVAGGKQAPGADPTGSNFTSSKQVSVTLGPLQALSAQLGEFESARPHKKPRTDASSGVRYS